MAYLMGLLMLLIPYLTGKGVLSLFYGKMKCRDFVKTDALITGCLVCIGFAEAAHLAGLFLGWSFSSCAKLFGFMTVVSSILGAVFCFVEKSSASRRKKSNHAQKPSFVLHQAFVALAGILILIQAVVIVMETNIYAAGDMTLETVNSFLVTDKIYQVNPLTGAAIEAGMPLRIQILGLPTLYGSMCYLFHLSARQLLWQIVPVFVLVCGYLIYFQIGCILFPKSKERQDCFLIVVILLMWAGDYLYGMDGFNILHSGFRGVAIRGMVMVPYAFSLILRKKWRLVILCIAAEACAVWTLYGMGVCLFIAAGMWIAGMVIQRIAESKNKQAGLQAAQK